MKFLIFIIIILLVIFVFLLDKLFVFRNFYFKFTSFFMKYFNICMFFVGFLIKFLFINVFSVNTRDINSLFIYYAESIVDNSVEKTELFDNLEQVVIDNDQEVSFWEKKVNIMGYEVSRKVIAISAVTLTIAIIGAYFYFRNGNSSIINVEESDHDLKKEEIVIVENKIIDIKEEVIIEENNNLDIKENLKYRTNMIDKNSAYSQFYYNKQVREGIPFLKNDPTMCEKVLPVIYEKMHLMDMKHLDIIITSEELKDAYSLNYRLVSNLAIRGYLVHPELLNTFEFSNKVLNLEELVYLQEKYIEEFFLNNK